MYIWVQSANWPPHDWEELLIVLTLGCLLLAYLCLTALTRLRRPWGWVRVVSQIAAALLAAWVATIVLNRLSEREALPALLVLIMLTGCGTLCTILLHWLGTLHRTDAVTTPLVLTLTCPRCGRSQEWAAGRGRCASCGLVVRIEIEEERCPRCGYSLYRLTSDRCPECGAPVFGPLSPSASAPPPSAPAPP